MPDENTLTPTQRLATIALGRPLADYVAEKRRAVPRWPWRLIATQLATDTEQQITLSAEILRTWYADDLKEAS